jgi:hypothetical protein
MCLQSFIVNNVLNFYKMNNIIQVRIDDAILINESINVVY